MSARPFPGEAAPRETLLLDAAVWEVPDRLSAEDWLIEAGLDGRRAVCCPDDPEGE